MNLVLVANVVSLKRLFNTGDRQAGGRWAESHGTLGGITRDAGRTLGTLGGHTERGVDSQTIRST